ncbi:MAG TPA: patatin-like phospholipase family protein [Solirubrobacteraceae bacterium]|nr:patatin-like phospholipase family protein [Solirubrobacteraceae bacterium]
MAAAHVPPLAAGGAGGPRRSLLLAGGGVRVAYQAGVLLALDEAQLRFHHADGASGGIFNLAMLMSGLGPVQACERWRALDVLSFASLPPLRRLLAGPPYPALGGAAGIRKRVLPALGVDVERIRAARGMDATFNVCDYATKQCVAVPHDEVDLDVLVAGVSLPIVSPAVRRDGRTLVDAVWIKDTNVTEALRRGAEELWLVWCIGNHGVYRDGAFQQYVHMIEIAANGALQGELELVRERGVRLHVVKPRVPLPLDPDLLFGRIDASTLIAMGYRDACTYLADPPPGGVPADASATRMEDPVPGVAFREHLVADGLDLRVGWEVDDLEAFMREPRGTVVGDATHERIGERRPARAGSFSVDAGGEVTAELQFDGLTVEVRRRLRDYADVEVSVDGAPPVSVTRRGQPPWVVLHARGTGSAREGAAARRLFLRWLRSAR